MVLHSRLAFRTAVIAMVGIAFSVGVDRAGAQDDANRAKQEAADQIGEGVGAMYEKQKDVDEGLSWRVELLPYLGHRNLYEEFHHDEPWDSEHNRKLISKMPQVYQSQAGLPEGKTTFVAPVSDRSVITQETGGIKIARVPDGASQTILFVSADRDHAVTWTRPEDIKFDPDRPLRGLGEQPSFTALFVDGSVHQIPSTIDAETMRRLVWRNDGQPVSLSEIR